MELARGGAGSNWGTTFKGRGITRRKRCRPISGSAEVAVTTGAGPSLDGGSGRADGAKQNCDQHREQDISFRVGCFMDYHNGFRCRRGAWRQPFW